MKDTKIKFKDFGFWTQIALVWSWATYGMSAILVLWLIVKGFICLFN